VFFTSVSPIKEEGLSEPLEPNWRKPPSTPFSTVSHGRV